MLIAWLTGGQIALAVGKWAAIALTILLFLLSLRRVGERAGRLAERLEKTEKVNETQRRMLEAAARRRTVTQRGYRWPFMARIPSP